MSQSIYPWFLLILALCYVSGLTYLSYQRRGLDPSYQFYDYSKVHVIQKGDCSETEVYGQFYNILESSRKMVISRLDQESHQVLQFRVNSPRPGILYINEVPVEIMLLPGDTTLKVYSWCSGQTEAVDSVSFEGKASIFCNYYREKSLQLHNPRTRTRRNVITARNFEQYVRKVDSFAARELVYLAEQEIFSSLPPWFVNFEKNEILYQRAYLKLSSSFQQNDSTELLDHVPIQNEGAVFSYYYYLYLNSYFNSILTEAMKSDRVRKLQSELRLADSLLDEEPHDMYISRVIFQQMASGNEVIARSLFDSYKNKFHSRKYSRYLEKQLKIES